MSYRGRVYAVGGMGVEEDLSSVEVLSPGAAEWRLLEDGMKEVNGWCSACLGNVTLQEVVILKPAALSKFLHFS